MFTLLQYIFNIAAGIFAGVVIVFFLYALGLLITPAKYLATIKSTYHATVLGTTATGLWLWYGLKFDIPFPLLMEILICIAALLLIFRRKALNQAALFKSIFIRQGFEFLALYSFFYILAYIFLLPPVSNDFLPITRIGNNDILNYINYAAYLQRLGPSNVSGYSFKDTVWPIYGFTPIVFYAIDGVAAFFNNEVIRAAMPTMFGIVALIGYVVVRLLRSAFGLPKSIAIGIAAIVVSGSLLRYIAGNYFLSEIVGVLIVLLIFLKTAEILLSGETKKNVLLMAWLLPYHFLLFYSYPPLFVIGVGLQAGFIFFFYVLSGLALPSFRFNTAEMFRAILPWAVAIICSSVIVALIDLHHVRLVFAALFSFAQKGVGGWVLNFISPLAVLGFPVSLQLNTLAAQICMTILFLVLMTVLGFFSLVRYRRLGWDTSGALFLLAVVAFLCYFVYIFHIGSSYQQWKLASYLLLPISFAILGNFCGLLLGSDNGARVRVKNYWPTTVVILVCFFIVSGNIIFHAFKEPQLERFSASYANLRALEMIGTSKDIYIQMASYSSTFWPVYFVHNKLLHLLSQSYYSMEHLNLQEVSPQKPLFIEGAPCVPGDFHDITIVGVGCLFQGPPSLKIGPQYSFSAPISGLLVKDGLSDHESWGQWSDSASAELNVMIESDDLLKHGSGFINIKVQPYLFKDIKAQDIFVSWGRGRHAQGSIHETAWVSLPYNKNDWSGFENREMTIKINFLDASSPHEVDPKNGDTRKLAIGFLAFSLTEHPLGKLLEQSKNYG